MSLLAARPKVHAVCAIRGKKRIFHGRVHFIFFPSHPAVLSLLTHLGLGARPPSCFFGKGGSRVSWLNSRDEEEGRDWGQGDRRTQGSGLRGRGTGFGACTRVCAAVFAGGRQGEKRARGESSNKPGLVLMNSAGPSPSPVASTFPSNSKTPEGGVGGNGGKGQIVSGGTGQVLGMRHRIGRTRGHCLACPWRWTFSATERRVDGAAADGEPRK